MRKESTGKGRRRSSGVSVPPRSRSPNLRKVGSFQKMGSTVSAGSFQT